MVVGGALGHHEYPQRLLLTVAGDDRAALGAHLLQFGLHRPRGLLGRGLVPVEPVELCLELGVLLGEPGIATAADRHGGSPAALSRRAKLVVLLDQTSEFALDLVQEGVDLLLVVPPLTDRRLLEGDVVDVGRG